MRVVLAADFPVQFLPGFDDAPTGHHATWLPPLARELSKATDFDFHWLTCTKATAEYVEIQHLNQTFHLLPRGKLFIEILTRFRRERHLIASLCEKLKPDLFHGWGTEQGYGLAANDFPAASLISLQGILTAYARISTLPLLTRIQAATERSLLSKAKHLTVESPWGAEQLRTLAPTAKIQLVEYGADPACFEIDRKLSEKPTAVFLGSLTHLKGVDTLLAAFSDPRLHSIDLHIYGAGNPAFSSGSHPTNIRFLGHRPRPETLEALSSAWCLVHPTRADTSPNAVKEARVIGLPVITTPNGGQTQYVTHEKSGCIHPAGDIEALIQAVLTTTRDREANLIMGSHDHERCHNLLLPCRTAQRLLEIYRQQ